jgi:hypothetical protein
MLVLGCFIWVLWMLEVGVWSFGPAVYVSTGPQSLHYPGNQNRPDFLLRKAGPRCLIRQTNVLIGTDSCNGPLIQP